MQSKSCCQTLPSVEKQSHGSCGRTNSLRRWSNRLIFCCRNQFAEFSYLRAADKKHGVPEHLEKTVLFLVDPSAVAKSELSGLNCDNMAAAAKECEAEATVAMKAAWKIAKEAKEVTMCARPFASL